MPPSSANPVPRRGGSTKRHASPFGPGNPKHPTLAYLFLRFLRYGLLAWGGPVAQIGLMHHELVARDRWISQTRFRKTLALYQALPGPEAHELAVYFGMIKRGRWGGFLTGLGFMLPGVVFVTTLAVLYVRYAATSTVADTLLYGTKPAVLALIAYAFVRLARASLPTIELGLIALGSAALGLLVPHLSFLLLLAAGGLIALAVSLAQTPGRRPHAAAVLAPFLLLTFPALNPSGLVALAWVSTKVGLLTFGGAYTAIPFLHQGAVVDHAWITDTQFLDALALSGLVPGPLVAVGTFVGYQAAGLAGAALATMCIFAPAFAFTLVGHQWFERLIHHRGLHTFLLGVTAAVLGLILVATVPLARAALVDPPRLVLAAAALVALMSRRVPVPWVVGGSALVGAALQWGARTA